MIIIVLYIKEKKTDMRIFIILYKNVKNNDLNVYVPEGFNT